MTLLYRWKLESGGMDTDRTHIGTWLNSDAKMINGTIPIPSNVTRLSRAIKAISQDGIPQIVNYQLGIGSLGKPIQRIVNGE